jgi:hypothetical protein
MEELSRSVFFVYKLRVVAAADVLFPINGVILSTIFHLCFSFELRFSFE